MIKTTLHLRMVRLGVAIVLVCGATLLQALPEANTVALIAVKSPQHIFGGIEQRVCGLISNSADRTVNLTVHTRAIQASSAIVMPLGISATDVVQIPPRQTIVASVQLQLPPVRTITRFLLQWLEDSNHVLGVTELRVYPPNLLEQFKSLADGKPVGLFDPTGELKPLLQRAGVEFADLAQEGTEKFSGPLAVFGPFDSKSQLPGELRLRIRALAKRGVAVVWLQPPPSEGTTPLAPTFYPVSAGSGMIVVVQHDFVADLAGNPQSQFNLVQLAQTAVRAQPFDLPQTEPPN